MFVTTKLPEIGCSYIPPDQCTGFTPAPCCERIDGVDGGGVIVKTSMACLLILCAIAAVL